MSDYEKHLRAVETDAICVYQERQRICSNSMRMLFVPWEIRIIDHDNGSQLCFFLGIFVNNAHQYWMVILTNLHQLNCPSKVIRIHSGSYRQDSSEDINSGVLVINCDVSHSTSLRGTC